MEEMVGEFAKIKVQDVPPVDLPLPFISLTLNRAEMQNHHAPGLMDKDSNGRPERRDIKPSRFRIPTRAPFSNTKRLGGAIKKKKHGNEQSPNSKPLKKIEKKIFEDLSENSDTEEFSIRNQVKIVKYGGRKMRRSICRNEKLDNNKILMEKRQEKVMNMFGTEIHDNISKCFGELALGPRIGLRMPKTSMAVNDTEVPDDVEGPSGLQ
ncbi:hypothetical protein KR018_007469 [Drosophila ironensis]|nr:hypothetical protein KR018_007469 [Drosophila ironensis]